MRRVATTADVLDGRATWSVECADAVAWLRSLPDDSVDLLFTSPPYELARTYGIGERMVGGEEWVAWMVEVVSAASPKVKGLIAVNCEGQTRGYRYSCVPFLLVADLHRAGFNLRKPPVFHRVGIPGSGGPDWLRNDYEPIVCVTRPGKLPWSDNTACGEPCRWAPGGAMSHRMAKGTRVNQWGKPIRKDGNPTGCDTPLDVGQPAAVRIKPSHVVLEIGKESYVPPSIANPGNVIALKVGGGHQGHPTAHANEAPFPLELAAFFVKSFCPPGGIVCDPFTGSGTTLDAAVQHRRRGVGCDVRESQCELVRRRMATVTPAMFA